MSKQSTQQTKKVPCLEDHWRVSFFPRERAVRGTWYELVQRKSESRKLLFSDSRGETRRVKKSRLTPPLQRPHSELRVK